MFRSEQARRGEQEALLGDIYYQKSMTGGTFDNELTIHGYTVNYYVTGDEQDHFFIGMTNRKEPGNHWLKIHVDDVDELCIALQYAKALSLNPELRRKPE